MPEEPTVYTLIYWLIKDKKIETSDLFNFAELFWPTFLQINNFVFLKEKFKEEYYQRLQNEKNQRIEYWLNFLTLEDFFSDLSDGDEQATIFCKILVETWKAKLERDFPDLTFTVKFLSDEENGDYGLTFYQKINDAK